jgi:hypothetical protein
MFENGVIKYVVDGDVCIVTYKRNAVIDNRISELIVWEKEKLTKSHNIRKYVGVLHSSVKVKPDTMKQFTTKDAIGGVDVIGVVYLSDKKHVEKFYSFGVRVLNTLVKALLKTPTLRFFTNETDAVNWAKSLDL